MPGEIVTLESARDPDLELVVERLRINRDVRPGDPLSLYADPLSAAILAVILVNADRSKVVRWASRAEAAGRQEDADFWRAALTAFRDDGGHGHI